MAAPAIEPGPPAAKLAKLIDSLPNVVLEGLQSYDGQAAHTTPFEARGDRTNGNMAKAVETKAMIEQDGIACRIVTGGSTGTYRFDSENPGMTELQPGSFIFMDLDYEQIGGPDGDALSRFQECIDGDHDRRIDAAGLRDRRWRLQGVLHRSPVHAAADRSSGCGLRLGRRRARPARSLHRLDAKVGDRVEFIPPHCDPTVNLYDQIYAMRGDRVEAVWPIAARGKSQ